MHRREANVWATESNLRRRFTQFAKRRILCLLVVCLNAASLGSLYAEQPIVLFDFEQHSLADEWSGVRNVRAQRNAAPEFSGEAEFAPGGQAVAIQTAGQGGLFTNRQAASRDWSKVESISFWIYRNPPPGVPVPSEMEVQLIEADGRTKFWRRVELTHQGWLRIELPLHWFRWGAGRVPRWDQIDRLGFWFRDAADVSIDSVAIVAGGDGAGLLTSDELREVAFAGGNRSSVQIIDSPQLRILTDATELDGEQLLTHLQRVATVIGEDLKLGNAVSTSAAKPTVLVFQEQRSYHGFPRLLARQLGSSSAAPRSSGYTLHGIATSYWDSKLGTLRPVYTHEFVHSYVALQTGIPNHGQWLHEGLAVRYQLRFHPQPNLRAMILRGLADDSLRESLEELCTDAPINNNRYWQAMTIVEMLLEDEGLARKWPQLLIAFSQSGSAGLAPYMKTILGMSWPELEETWQRHCRQKYGMAALGNPD